MTTVLVTGGCGFIGSHFLRLLLTETDWRLVNLDKLTYAASPERLEGVAEGDRYRFVQADIADADAVDAILAEERPWAVVNFAAESHVDRSILDATPFLRTNVLGVQVLLDAVRRHGVERFLHISTDEVYGDREGLPPAGEDDSLRPSSPYAASKAAADLLCLSHWRTYGTPVLIVRSANNYGPYQFPEKLIPLMLRNALLGAELPVYGDGLQVRDWLYVEDNVRAVLAVLQRGATGEIYNVSAYQQRPNLEVVHTLCRLVAEETGQPLGELLGRVRSVTDRPGHDRRYAVRAERVREELGWHPRIDFQEGMRRTVRWYLEHRRWLEEVTRGAFQEYYDSVYRRAWGQRHG